MVERIEVLIDGTPVEVYLVPLKGLTKVIGSGIVPDRDYFATLEQVKRITQRQLILAGYQ